MFLSIKDSDKGPELAETAQTLHDLGLKILATSGTAGFLRDHGIPSEVVNKAYEGGRTIVDIMKDGGVDLVLNTTEGPQAIADSRSMRNVALMDKIPYFTTLSASHAAAQAMKAAREGSWALGCCRGSNIPVRGGRIYLSMQLPNEKNS